MRDFLGVSGSGYRGEQLPRVSAIRSYRSMAEGLVPICPGYVTWRQNARLFLQHPLPIQLDSRLGTSLRARLNARREEQHSKQQDHRPGASRNCRMFSRGTADVAHRVDPGSRNAGARVHAAAVHSEVKPARSDTQPGAVQAEVDMNAGSDANRTAEAQGHRQLAYTVGPAAP
jgi:hypothetical protein